MATRRRARDRTPTPRRRLAPILPRHLDTVLEELRAADEALEVRRAAAEARDRIGIAAFAAREGTSPAALMALAAAARLVFGTIAEEFRRRYPGEFVVWCYTERVRDRARRPSAPAEVLAEPWRGIASDRAQ
jgi:hypothetical protein